jgi:hypothetical protein
MVLLPLLATADIPQVSSMLRVRSNAVGRATKGRRIYQSQSVAGAVVSECSCVQRCSACKLQQFSAREVARLVVCFYNLLRLFDFGQLVDGL